MSVTHIRFENWFMKGEVCKTTLDEHISKVVVRRDTSKKIIETLARANINAQAVLVEKW